MVTLAEIARQTGYSVTAVSRVLNARPGTKRKVSDAAAARIRITADRLGYRPNLAASFLRRGRNSVIGVFLPPYRTSYIVDLTMGLVEVAEQNSYPLSFAFDFSPEHYLNFLKQNAGRRNCGIVSFSIFAFREDARRIMVDYMRSGGKVILLNSGNTTPEFPELKQPPPMVQIDDAAGARAAAEYLLAFHPEKLFFICGISLRRNTFLDVVNSADAEVEEFAESEEGYASLLCRVKACSGPVGIFCGADRMAVRVHSMLLRAGLIPGERVHLVGYDDLYPLSELSPALTSVAQPFQKLGHLAMKKLIAMIGGNSVTSELLTPQLVVRET